MPKSAAGMNVLVTVRTTRNHVILELDRNYIGTQMLLHSVHGMQRIFDFLCLI